MYSGHVILVSSICLAKNPYMAFLIQIKQKASGKKEMFNHQLNQL